MEAVMVAKIADSIGKINLLNQEIGWKGPNINEKIDQQISNISKILKNLKKADPTTKKKKYSIVRTKLNKEMQSFLNIMESGSSEVRDKYIAETIKKGELKKISTLFQLLSGSSEADKQALKAFERQIECLDSQLNKLQPTYSDALKKFCLNEIASAMLKKPEGRQLEITAVKELIGKIIYLLDSGNTDNLTTKYNRFNFDITKRLFVIVGIHNSYDTALEELRRETIKPHSNSQTLPMAYASMLITNDGYLNIDIIKSIKILEENEILESQVERIFDVLDQLSKYPRLQEIITSIKAPALTNIQSNKLIRTNLLLHRDTKIKDRHARRVALIALMINHRQNSGRRTCASTAFAIRTLSTNAEQCLIDFSEMLEKGYLTRTIEGKERQFPIINKAFPDHANAIRKLHKNNIGNYELLVPSPDLMTVFNCLEIRRIDLERVLDQAVKSYLLTKGLDDPDKIDIRLVDLVSHIIKVAFPDLTPDQQIEKRDLICYEIDSIYQNPLITSWESILYSICYCVHPYHQKKLEKSFKDTCWSMTTLEKSKVNKKFINQFWDKITENFQYFYDCNVDAGDEFISALAMYAKGVSNNWTESRHIQNADQFKGFLSSMLNDLEKNNTEKDCEIVIAELRKLINSDVFVENIIRTLKKGQNELKEPKALSKKIRTPWRIRTGVKAAYIHHGYWNEILTPIVIPQGTTSEFAKNLFIFYKSPTICKPSLPKKHSLVSFHQGCHAYNLRLTDPLMTMAAQKYKTADEWIKQMQITAMAIAKEPLDLNFNLLEYFLSLKELVKIPDEELLYDTFVKKLEDYRKKCGKTISMLQFKEFIFDLVKEYRNISNDQEVDIMGDIINILPKDKHALFLKNCVSFCFDLNYTRNGFNVYECLIFNPFTNEFALGQYSERLVLTADKEVPTSEVELPEALLPEHLRP